MVMDMLKSKRSTGKRNVFSSLSTKKFNAEEIQQKIEKKAYELFEQRGASHGSDLEDWLEAERIILAEISQSTR